MSIQIESIFVGSPQRFYSEDASKIWDSAIVKRQVAGLIRVAMTNLDGDEQANLVHHGGPDKAVLAYPAAHYDYWRQLYPEIEWSAGCFGENLSLSNATELDCCIGDFYQVADCVMQVSQPRQYLVYMAHFNHTSTKHGSLSIAERSTTVCRRSLRERSREKRAAVRGRLYSNRLRISSKIA